MMFYSEKRVLGGWRSQLTAGHPDNFAAHRSSQSGSVQVTLRRVRAVPVDMLPIGVDEARKWVESCIDIERRDAKVRHYDMLSQVNAELISQRELAERSRRIAEVKLATAKGEVKRLRAAVHAASDVISGSPL